jgi:glycosyltransferase involved in cell wall biosynthesis
MVMGLVLTVTNRPTPYRLPLYQELARRLSEQGESFHVHFLGNARSSRRWKIPEGALDGVEHSIRNEDRSAGRAAIETVRRLSPSVVLIAWSMDLTALRLLLYCRRRRIACLVVSGESPYSARANSYRRLREIYRTIFFRLASGFISYGRSASQYLLDSGLPPSRLTTGINVVDTEFFRRSVDAERQDGSHPFDSTGRSIEETEGIRFHLLFVGYLLPEKGVGETIEALRQLQRRDVALHIVGDGPMMESIRTQIISASLGDRVFLHGYQQTEELPRYYAFADAVIFPSLWEVFGLVMVEAAAAGLPIIASKFAGGTADIVDDGINGVVVDPSNAAEAAHAIAHLADNPDLRKRMGLVSRRRAEEVLTLSESARRYLEGIIPHLVSSRSKRPRRKQTRIEKSSLGRFDLKKHDLSDFK